MDQDKNNRQRGPETPLDETRYMSPAEQQQFEQRQANANQRQNDMDDTQNLHPVDVNEPPETGLGRQQPPHQIRQSGVRELPPLTPQEMREKGITDPREEERRRRNKRRRNAVILIIGFIFALLAGFFAAGYQHDKSELAANERQHQQQEIQQKQDKLDMQERDLERQRRDLEQQKRDLEQRKQALLNENSRIEGRQDQLKDQEPTSAVGKLIDKVTGEADKRRQTQQEYAKQGEQAKNEAATVDKSIKEAENALGEVNRQLDNVQSMRQDVSKVKQQLENTYAENTDTIDRVAGYIQEGAYLLRRALTE